MKTFEFNRKQVKQIMSNIVKQRDGIKEIMHLTLESIMQAEREVFTSATSDVGNGYRYRRAFSQGKILELRVPRTRYQNFYPVLLSILKDQEAEAQRLAFSLYSAGLTGEQVGNIFEEFYGRNYSKSSISRMIDYARDEVQGWLERPLDSYYPIVYIDATFVPTRRGDTVSKEAYYTILGVRSDRTREVLAIVNHPTESGEGWSNVFADLKKRGVDKIGLVVGDASSGIENAIARHFSGTPFQKCIVHLKRNLQRRIRISDKKALKEDVNEVFRCHDINDTPEKGWNRWVEFCHKWARKYPRFRKMTDKGIYYYYFTYLGYDYRIRSMIYSTNWVERLNKDYKRVLKMRGAMPNPESVILLLGRVAMTRDSYDRKVPKLNYEEEKFDWDN